MHVGRRVDERAQVGADPHPKAAQAPGQLGHVDRGRIQAVGGAEALKRPPSGVDLIHRSR